MASVRNMDTAVSGAPPTNRAASRSIVRRAWLATSSAFAGVLGVAPHVLHHAGPLAGAALFAGVGGSLFFGALGFLLAIPFLIRLRRRFGTWRAPTLALVVFISVFSISTFVIGPAITRNGSDGSSTQRNERPTPATPQSEHESHHD
jgi:hypothetical protein